MGRGVRYKPSQFLPNVTQYYQISFPLKISTQYYQILPPALSLLHIQYYQTSTPSKSLHNIIKYHASSQSHPNDLNYQILPPNNHYLVRESPMPCSWFGPLSGWVKKYLKTLFGSIDPHIWNTFMLLYRRFLKEKGLTCLLLLKLGTVPQLYRQKWDQPAKWWKISVSLSYLSNFSLFVPCRYLEDSWMPNVRNLKETQQGNMVNYRVFMGYCISSGQIG